MQQWCSSFIACISLFTWMTSDFKTNKKLCSFVKVGKIKNTKILLVQKWPKQGPQDKIVLWWHLIWPGGKKYEKKKIHSICSFLIYIFVLFFALKCKEQCKWIWLGEKCNYKMVISCFFYLLYFNIIYFDINQHLLSVHGPQSSLSFGSSY